MTTPARPPLAELLRDQMRLLGLSQADVAARVGVRQQTVSKWLTGETQPRVKLLPTLAETLGLQPTDLSQALVPPTEEPTAEEMSELRVTAFARRLRDLTPDQMDRLEAYLIGLQDGVETRRTDTGDG